jgi:hypothetical protein
MAKRGPQTRPNAQQGQPHDPDREKRQPYAKELEDYAQGVVIPPEAQVGKRETAREAITREK